MENTTDGEKKKECIRLITTKPNARTEEDFRKACWKFANGEATIDYILSYILKKRLIKIIGGLNGRK